MTRRLPRPNYPALVCGAAALVVLRWLGAFDGGHDAPALAFWGFIIAIGQAIWAGIQAAGHITLTALYWIVQHLRVFAVSTYNGLLRLGQEALKGFKLAWDFLRKVYDDVLLPAWRKFWSLVDAVRRALDDVFRPVFKLLYRIRDELLKFYKHWVRPILDTIELVRRVLRVLETLHVPLARAIDDALGKIESRIDTVFHFVLAKVNDIINVVNRVVTADGLFQRLALIRSIERDIKYVFNELHNARDTPLTNSDRAALATKNKPPDADEMLAGVTDGFRRQRPSLWTDAEWAEMNAAVFGARV